MIVCFSGHRNIYGYNYNDRRYVRLMNKLDEYLLKEGFYKDGNKFISGGAIGFDTLVYKMIHIQKKNHNIKNILAIPFFNQSKKWKNEDKQVYEQMKIFADETIFVDALEEYRIKTVPIGMYHPAKMQKRNMFMVDNSDVVISCWNGSKSGTFNCIKYAKKKGKKIINIDPVTLEIREI